MLAETLLARGAASVPALRVGSGVSRPRSSPFGGAPPGLTTRTLPYLRQLLSQHPAAAPPTPPAPTPPNLVSFIKTKLVSDLKKKKKWKIKPKRLEKMVSR